MHREGGIVGKESMGRGPGSEDRCLHRNLVSDRPEACS